MRHIFYLSLPPIFIGIYALAYYLDPYFYYFYGIAVPLTLLGFRDILQTKRTILRNYPVLGHFRYLLEEIRPEIQQYFIERDTDGKPFSRQERSVIYQRAKGELDTSPFGTQLDLYKNDAEWIEHSLNHVKEIHEEPKVLIGNHQCSQPYLCSRLNISAMSYGSLSKTAILALSQGAKKGSFYHNSGEGGISPYHLEGGADIVWQIGTGYFGCRNADGSFNGELFQERASNTQVKMIEIKLSQGAKPGHGGILPAAKVNDEVVKIRNVEKGKDVVSPPWHKEFNTPLEMMDFIKKLRDLSGGKPVGIKLCIGRSSEFFSICKAMLAKDIYPDFITVDGAEGGTGAAPREFSNHIGTPLLEGLNFVNNTLLGFDLRKKIKVICSGKVFDGFTMINKFALGADICNSARGMMMSIGCIQALRCNSNNCPAGIATQDPRLYKLINVEDKSKRVARYHQETIKQMLHLVSAMGLENVEDIKKTHIKRRLGMGNIVSYADLYDSVEVGEFLDLEKTKPVYKQIYAEAQAERF